MNKLIFEKLLLLGFIASGLNTYPIYQLSDTLAVFNLLSAFTYLFLYLLLKASLISTNTSINLTLTTLAIMTVLSPIYSSIESLIFIWIIFFPFISFILKNRLFALISSLAIMLTLWILFAIGTLDSSFNFSSMVNYTIFYILFTIMFYVINFNFDTQAKSHKNQTKLLKEEIHKATLQLQNKNDLLTESLNNTNNLFDLTMEMIVLFDKDKNIVDINHSGAIMLGFDAKEELIGLNIAQFLPKEGLAEVAKNLQSETATPYEINLLKKDGSTFPTIVSGRYIQYEGNTVRMSTIMDLTQIKQNEKLIIEQSRMANMGEMISMIAHQWRQPLNAISSNISLIQFAQATQKYDLDSKTGQDEYEAFLVHKQNAITTSVLFLSNTINDFRNFLKKDTEMEACTLNKPINLALSMVQVPMQTDCDIKFTLALENNATLNLLTNELTQVILNILKNAEENFIEKSIENPLITISTLQTDKHILKICDNGGGIPEEILSQVFDPYFSTKHSQNGTGLGMYMSKKIIHEHLNGELSVYNTSEGACFEISFAKADKEVLS